MALAESSSFAIGTTNKAKVEALNKALKKIIPDRPFNIIPVSVPSGVSAQPMSDEECILGATNRAKASLIATPTADFGVGMEGGLQKIGNLWYECGWIAVVNKKGELGIGSSARFELSAKIMKEILAGKELAEVMDAMTQMTDVRSNMGAMGVVTNGLLHRDECYTHGIIFAFAKFISDPKYWL